MFKVSYLNIASDSMEIKAGFKSDKAAYEWAKEQEKAGKIIPMKCLIWSEMLNACRTVFEF